MSDVSSTETPVSVSNDVVPISVSNDVVPIDSFPSKEDLEAAMNDVPTQEDQDLSVLGTDEERAIGRKLMPGLVARISQQAEAQKAKKLAEEVDQLRSGNEKQLRETINNIQKQMAPPDEKQLEKLLTQEYMTMTVPVEVAGGSKRDFVIRELPQFYEKRIVDIISRRLMPFLKDVQAIDFKSTGTVADRLTKVITVIPEAFDALAEVCAVALDPRETDGINVDWVQKNLASHRIAAIVEAQFVVSKIRDFMSAAYRLIPQ
jgi:hypothetical protein